MHLRLNHMYNTPNKNQRGITLIESLVAIVIAALGILGILGVQMRTLTDTQTSVRRAQAIRLVEDLAERMTVNPNALAELDTYVTTFADASSGISATACATGCGPEDLAKYDLKRWKKNLEDTLPLGQAAVFVPPAESALAPGLGRQIGVMIAWRESERDGFSAADKDNIDATKINDGGTFKSAAGAAAACPADHTCHLQYIPVAGRCAPYAPGGGTSTYYCPGA